MNYVNRNMGTDIAPSAIDDIINRSHTQAKARL